MLQRTFQLAWILIGAALFAACGGSGSGSGDEDPGAEVAPDGLSYFANPALYSLDIQIVPNAPTLAQGQAESWEVAPRLPAGLNLNVLTGVISGTPLVVQPATIHTVTAMNSLGSTTVDLSITVIDPSAPPSDLRYSVNPAIYTVGATISPNVPTVTGIVDVYTILPTLPPGLNLSSITGIINGTPTAPLASTIHVVTATNQGGSTTVDLDIAVLPAPPDTRFVYVAADDTLSTYTIDAGTGQLTQRGHVTTGAGPRSVATTAPGSFVYVANGDDHTISKYSADVATGALTEIAAPTPTATRPSDVAVHPSGLYCYVANQDDNVVSKYTIGAGGDLTEISAAASTGNAPVALAISPSGNYLFVAASTDRVIYVYAVASGSGELVGVQIDGPFEILTDLTVHPSGKYLYAVGGLRHVFAFTIDPTNGNIASIPGSPFLLPVATGSDPRSVAVSINGRNLYTANGSGSVASFTIDLLTGELSSPSGVPTGADAQAVAVSGKADYVFTVNETDSSVYTFDVAVGGALFPSDPAPIVRARPTPRAIAVVTGTSPVHFRSSYVYTANAGSGDATAYSADAATGDLTELAGSPYAAGPGAQAASIHPSNGFLYTANASDGGISLFAIDPATGALAAGTGIASGNVTDLLLEGSGQFAFGITSGTPAGIQAYTIDPSNGQLTASGGVFAIGDGDPYGAVDPTATYVYTANGASDDISVARIDASDGALTAVETEAAGDNPVAVALHPTGRWLYACNRDSNDVSQYRVDPATGALDALTTPTIANPGDAQNLTVHPAGKFLYVANGAANEVRLFSISTGSGQLSNPLSGGSTLVGSEPLAARVDASGKFLYVTTTAGDETLKFTIDPFTGALGGMTAQPAGGDPRGLARTTDYQ